MTKKANTMGKVVLVGAGPGAADLITVRGLRWLEQADVVLFDALTDPGFRALAPQARWLDVGKRGFCQATGQVAINAALLHWARRVQLVVRLKGGDPSVFGRAEEELSVLHAAGIEVEVVPGVTAALAAAADTQRPLTRRGHGRSVSLTTAMTRDGDLYASRSADTEVFYMAGRQLPALSRRLLAAGWPPQTPVSLVSRAGCADSLASHHALADMASGSVLHAGRPTVVIAGVGARTLPATAPPGHVQALGSTDHTAGESAKEVTVAAAQDKPERSTPDHCAAIVSPHQAPARTKP